MIKSLGKGWRLPSEEVQKEPHRSVEIVTIDVVGAVFTGPVSSHMAHLMGRVVMWREISQVEDAQSD